LEKNKSPSRGEEKGSEDLGFVKEKMHVGKGRGIRL